MQLKVKRSQREKGLISSKTYFTLDIMADYSAEERANVTRYKIGNETVYDALAHAQKTGREWNHNLVITLDSLAKGHHIECRNLNELLEAENMIVDACRKIKNWLAIAVSFDGREILIDLDERSAA